MTERLLDGTKSEAATDVAARQMTGGNRPRAPSVFRAFLPTEQSPRPAPGSFVSGTARPILSMSWRVPSCLKDWNIRHFQPSRVRSPARIGRVRGFSVYERARKAPLCRLYPQINRGRAGAGIQLA